MLDALPSEKPETIEALLEQFEDWAHWRGADEDQIRRVRALYARFLLEAVLMLRTGSTTLQ